MKFITEYDSQKQNSSDNSWKKLLVVGILAAIGV